MISTRYLKMEKVEGVSDTEEKIRNVRQALEYATQDSIERLNRARLESFNKSRYIVLD